MMKQILQYSIFISISILFSGCPYESTVPIDAPSIQVNPNLFGTWKDSLEKESYKVSKSDDYTYKIEKIKDGIKEKDVLFAYTSLIDGIPFLNMYFYDPNEPERKYSFYKLFILSNDRITLSEVTENIDEHFRRSADLKNFFKQNMNHSFFYSKQDMTLKRADK
jgi:hypothetical protein